jgi:L-threonylcarbamoyladenylate synthase
MASEFIKFDPAHSERAFSRCKEVVSSGGVIAYPTDTFYGLGVDPRNSAAVKKLFLIKGRHEDRPILLLIPDRAAVWEWAAEVTPMAGQLMERFWPGPLTLVFKAKHDVLPELIAGTGSIGLRLPGSALTRQLLGYLGVALTGTSANLSGKQGIETAEEAREAFGDAVDLVLDGGRTAGGKPSTVVDVRTDSPHVLREGAALV